MDYRIKIAIVISAGVVFLAVAVAGMFVLAHLSQKFIGMGERHRPGDMHPGLFLTAAALLVFAACFRPLSHLLDLLIHWLDAH